MESETQTFDTESKLQRFLQKVEKAGNALPNPAILFLCLFLFVIFLSAVFFYLKIESINPVTNENIIAKNLLSAEGLRLILTDLVKNFTGFAPLGTVLTALLGFSIAEKSGLIGALLRILVIKSPKKLLVPAILLAGVLSHTGGDIGYVLLIPLAGLGFLSAGMHPVAGIAICFAGVSGGFAANILLSTADTLLSGISQEAARIISKDYIVTPISNWYFMSASSLMIIGVGSLVASKITIPFLGSFDKSSYTESMAQLSEKEKKALRWTGIFSIIFIAIMAIGVWDESSFLRDPKTPDFFHSALLKGIVAIIFIYAAVCGVIYGYISEKFKNHHDVVKAMQESMQSMAPYLVLVFFASQFISLFNASNIGLILAVKGSIFFKGLGLSPILLMVAFIFLTIFLDLVIGSASAKWALMAPIFVPMFMLLGISPELSQASYRIADSVVNIISPLMPYFPMILVFMNKYDARAKVGTLIALMLPYTISFLISWLILLFAWIQLGLPLGPGAGLDFHL